MLELIDLRSRRERLEPRRLEIHPSVEEAVRGIILRVRDGGDGALLDLTIRFDGADLRATGLVTDPRAAAAMVRNAGALFVGNFTPVPFGDYGVASNHVLPTAGTARFASGLRAADFVTVSSVEETSDDAAAALAPEVATIARAEGLVGHARAAEIRAERRGPT